MTPIFFEVAGHRFRCRESVSLASLERFGTGAFHVRADEERSLRLSGSTSAAVVRRQLRLVADFVELALPPEEQERFSGALALNGQAFEAELVGAIASTFDQLKERATRAW